MYRKLLIVNQYARSLTVEIANAFVRSGKYEEIVIAAGNEILPDFHLDNSVKIQKIASYNIKNTRTRLLSWIKATIKIVCMCWFKYRNFELFLISNPPTTAFIHYFCKNKYSTLVWDVFPEGLRDFAPQGSFINNIWSKNNIRFYKKAEHVFTISEGLKDTISQYCPREKIEIVSLWATPNLKVVKVPQNENPFILKHKEELFGKFIIMYSGNMGKAHPLKCLIEVANQLRDYPDIVFLFVGEGYGKQPMQERVKELHLEKQCIFYSFQPVTILPYSLSCSNLSVVSASYTSKSSCLPSKIFDLIKLGKAILCIADDDLEISRMVNELNIGVNRSSSDIDGIRNIILELYNNRDAIREFEKNAMACAPNYTNKLAENFVK